MNTAAHTATDARAVPTTGTARRAGGLRRFLLHFVEMVVAMAVGMVALQPLWSFAAGALELSQALHRTEVMAMVMATDMTVAMSAWMRYRGHGWRSIVEMGAAMYLPFLVLFVPLWAGALSSRGLMIGGHALMLPAMLAAMLLRRDEYAYGHHC
jgi:hypothetical protein